MSMHYYRATIQYAGTNYAGFQFQNESSTVQSEINKALTHLIKDKVTTVAASRTDTGVHAREQIVKITSAQSIDCLHFLKSMNAVLPADIRFIKLEECAGSFRPSSEAVSKEYRYFFTNKTQVHKDEMQFTSNIANELNLGAMQECVAAIIGEHAFSNFYSTGSNVKSTIRTISFCELKKVNPHDVFEDSDLFKFPSHLQSCFQLKIVAKGFLKQMIRHIVSSLWMVGTGKISTAEFQQILSGPRSERQLWKVAPPNGLFLFKIDY